MNDYPRVIAAIRTSKDLEAAINAPTKAVFLLSGDIRTLEEHCNRLNQAKKQVFLHLDLVEGLKGDAAGIAFAAERFRINGIISTKTTCLKHAKEAGLIAILRVFIIDSSALKTGIQLAKNCKPDWVEILPGVAPKIIKRATAEFNLPIIAGGLIQERQDVEEAIAAGATAVSTSRRELWSP